MLTKEIHSLQHPIIKHLFKLRQNRGYREKTKSALLVGKKEILELGTKTVFKTFLVQKGHRIPKEIRAASIFYVPPSILKKVSGVETPEPFLAEISLPPSPDLKDISYLVVFNGIKDPGNLGTLIRTALAFGWEAAFLTPGTTDPFSDKALRASKGASLLLPLYQGSIEELNALVKENKLNVYVADIEGESFDTQKVLFPLALVLGSESQGASSELKKQYTPIAIPMHAKMESLNVAVAGGILMYKIKEGR